MSSGFFVFVSTLKSNVPLDLRFNGFDTPVFIAAGFPEGFVCIV
jgi:hypothetical protein